MGSASGSWPAAQPALARVAQGIERRFPKPCVAGSNPAVGTGIPQLQSCVVPTKSLLSSLWQGRCGKRHQGGGSCGCTSGGMPSPVGRSRSAGYTRRPGASPAPVSARRPSSSPHSWPRLTTESTAGEYIAHIERMGRAPTPLYGYRRIVAKRIGPALGSKRLDKLTAHDLDRFYADQLATGLGDRSVHHIHRQISAALRQGRKWGWVVTNVAEDATPPKLRRAEMNVPSPEQVTALIAEAARPETRAPEMAAVITVLALTGMRRGELCGLRWSDVDWQGSAVNVNQAIWQTREGMGAKAPKTHQARRLVLGENAVAVLSDRHARARADAEMAKVKLPDSAYIFSPDVDGAGPIHPDSVSQACRRITRRMEEPALAKLREENPKASRADLAAADRWDFRLHDLRHYTATQLFAAGLNPKTVADRLGHADPSVTLRVYTANTDAQAQEAADSLEAGLVLPPMGRR
jgi:integrase